MLIHEAKLKDQHLRVKQEQLNTQFGLNDTLTHDYRTLTYAVKQMGTELRPQGAISRETSEWAELLQEDGNNRLIITIEADEDQ